MTDTPKERDMGLKVALPSRPWTAGPWTYRGWGEEGHDFPLRDAEGFSLLLAQCDSGYSCMGGTGVEWMSDLDGELAALAPEMAEAILQADFACQCMEGQGTADAFGKDCPVPLVHAVAEKLRAIGGSHE